MNGALTIAFFFACFFGLVSASAIFDHLGNIGIARWKFYAIPAFCASVATWGVLIVRRRRLSKEGAPWIGDVSNR